MRLGVGDLTCHVANPRDLRRNMLEKLVWICSFMLVGAVILLPVIFAYTAYAYWVFRGKVSDEGYH